MYVTRARSERFWQPLANDVFQAFSKSALAKQLLLGKNAAVFALACGA